METMLLNKEIADKYQEFFNFFSEKHKLVLSIDQMQEILSESRKLEGKLKLPKCGNKNAPCAPNLKFGGLICDNCDWSE